MGAMLSWLVRCLLLCAACAAASLWAAPLVPIDRLPYDKARDGRDLRGAFEYAMVPMGAVDPDQVWNLPANAFTPSRLGQALEIPAGQMMLLRVEVRVERARNPDYLQLPSPRLDRARIWARAEGFAWQAGEAGDRVPLSRWPFGGPFPSFELPDSNGRMQIVMAIEQRGTLRVPVQWMPDLGYRSQRLNHAYAFGAMFGLALALALVCALATLILRRRAFAAMCGYTVLTGLSIAASNGYASVYLWPESPQWSDPSKVFLGILLTSALLPLVALVLQLHVRRPLWWRGALAWGVAGLAYAGLQAFVLPPEWRTYANLGYALGTLGIAAALAVHGVLRADAMSRWALAGIVMIAAATALNYADLFDIVNVLELSVANALLRMGFIVTMLVVVVQRHRFGRDVLSRHMTGVERDALTGLLSREGLEREVARMARMQDPEDAAEQAGVIVCDLPRLEGLRTEMGGNVVERMLVRYAYVLQRNLHDDNAAIARIGEGRFAAVLGGVYNEFLLRSICQQLVAQMLAQTDLPGAVKEAGMEIYMSTMPLAAFRIDAVEARMGKSLAAGTRGGRSIHWMAGADA